MRGQNVLILAARRWGRGSMFRQLLISMVFGAAAGVAAAFLYDGMGAPAVYAVAASLALEEMAVLLRRRARRPRRPNG